DAGELENIAEVAATSATGVDVEDDDAASLTIAPDAGISVSKTGTLAEDGAVGDEITFEFVVTNSGNVTLTAITLDDSLLGLTALPAGAAWSPGSSAATGLLP